MSIYKINNHETAENWKHSKEMIFDAYEHLRYFLDDGIPEYNKSFFYDKSLVENVEPIIYQNG